MAAVGLLLLSTVLVAGQFGDVFGKPFNGGGVVGTFNVNPDECMCVKYSQCVNNTIITEAGRRLIQVRMKECDGSLSVCCKLPDVLLHGVDRYVSAPMTPGVCGSANPAGVDFTLDGAQEGETNFGEFPWMVALLRRERVPEHEVVLHEYYCGGSLIHPRVVLTAAHCVVFENINDIVIRAGEWDTQTTDEPLAHQDRNVSQVIVHEDYDNDTLYNDVALLILQEPVVLNEHINVVCLPSQGENFDHKRCFSGGWGKDKFGKAGQWTAILKKRELPIVPPPTCQTALRTALYGPLYNLHDSFICAGGEVGIDTCKGDGGSHLVCPVIDDPLRFKQAGIVSWGLGCGNESLPGLYANVAIRRDWIDQMMGSNNFDTSSYTYSKRSL